MYDYGDLEIRRPPVLQMVSSILGMLGIVGALVMTVSARKRQRTVNADPDTRCGNPIFSRARSRAHLPSPFIPLVADCPKPQSPAAAIHPNGRKRANTPAVRPRSNHLAICRPTELASGTSRS